MVETGQMVHRINQEAVVLLGWGRAVLLQLAHPLVAAAVADHSDYWSGPLPYLRRIHRTVGSMLGLTFGTPDEVQAAADRINAIHERVHGQLREETGRFPAGTYYTATDPALLTWVHVTLVDSQLLAYETFVQSLSRDEKDRYCSEASEFASLLKIPRGFLPTDHSKLTGHLSRFCEDGPVKVTDTALRLSRDLLYPPGGVMARALLGLGRLATAGLLPDSIRLAYGLSWNKSQQRRFRAVAGVIRRARSIAPRSVSLWASARRTREEPPTGRCPIH